MNKCGPPLFLFATMWPVPAKRLPTADLDINDEICVVTQPNISDEYWEKIREYTKNVDELQT
jgi:hypothetical protein